MVMQHLIIKCNHAHPIIGSDKSVINQVEVVSDTVTDGDTVPIVQVQSQPVASTSLK